MPMTTVTPPSLDDLTTLVPKKMVRARPLFDRQLMGHALVASFVKLNPVTLFKNPVIFVVEVGATLTSFFLIRDMFIRAPGIGFSLQISLWLWFTVLFANFAEAMAEARGKAQADTLRKAKTDSMARRVVSGGCTETIPASKLRAGDVVICEVGEIIPGDGEVIEGNATVDESV
ncbi:MAG TPA: potassium-transporting ATPase subunit B, partial [Terriglobia bacterium]|nr:potassium-transporting ATPase subunit B [Terriglobia bacterium]